MNCERNICYQQEYNGGCDTCPCNRTADESSEVEITTQEAMETLKFLLSIERHHKEPLRMAIEALEKQVPKEPDYEGDGYWDGELVYDTWICPNCGKDYEVGYDNYKYCPECGQAIDWSEEDE